MKQIDLSKIRGAYLSYAHGGEKKALNARIIENNRWYRQQYTELESREDREKPKSAPASKSGYIFSAIANKHADAMDNYPDINVLPREAGDVGEAKKLTAVLPCVLELSGFRETYSGNWWYKLKNGTACYGVFWNPREYGGLGEIEIKKVDLLNLAWQPGIHDLQDSKYLFYSYYMDKEEFAQIYGKDKLSKTDSVLEMETYSGHRTEAEEENVLVVDCYYKVRSADGHCALHLVKFSGEHILEQTEGKEEYPNGLYEHGKYPFVFDVMYPNEDSPAGFGVIDVVKNPQAYIDKLDALLAENSVIVGKTRYFIKDNGGVNEEEYSDLEKPFVHVAGSLDERNILPIVGQALPEQISRQREQKINELKEVIGNRDFQQGGTSGGVTAASAISILQQAGDKLSRDLIDGSYRAYRLIVEMCIELIRQFYSVERSFRITGESGEQEFTFYSNEGINPQREISTEAAYRIPQMAQSEETFDGRKAVGVPGASEGLRAPTKRSMFRRGKKEGRRNGQARRKTDAEVEHVPTWGEDFATTRKPEFDVRLSVQRSNPFTKEQQNQTIMQLWSAGFFNPQAVDVSLIALEFMQFEGKEKMMEKLAAMRQEQKQAALAQQTAEQNRQLQQMANSQAGELLEVPLEDEGNNLVEIPLNGGENSLLEIPLTRSNT